MYPNNTIILKTNDGNDSGNDNKMTENILNAMDIFHIEKVAALYFTAVASLR